MYGRGVCIFAKLLEIVSTRRGGGGVVIWSWGGLPCREAAGGLNCPPAAVVGDRETGNSSLQGQLYCVLRDGFEDGAGNVYPPSQRCFKRAANPLRPAAAALQAQAFVLGGVNPPIPVHVSTIMSDDCGIGVAIPRATELLQDLVHIKGLLPCVAGLQGYSVFTFRSILPGTLSDKK